MCCSFVFLHYVLSDYVWWIALFIGEFVMNIFIDLFFYGLVVLIFFFTLRKIINKDEKEVSDLLNKKIKLEFEMITLRIENEKLKLENEQIKTQVKKMENCQNCKNQRRNKRMPLTKECFYCKNYSNWELAE